jgi:hypothetical protein
MNLVAAIALASISSTVAFSGLSRISRDRVAALSDQRREVDVLTRRETLESWVVGAAAISTGFLTSPEMALAFPNKISNQYDDRPKQRGSKVCGLSPPQPNNNRCVLSVRLKLRWLIISAILASQLIIGP